MEKEGLQRVLQFLQQHGWTIEVLVTDRHNHINKWLRESYSTIAHYYDVWHYDVSDNTSRKQAVAAKGQEHYGILYPKYKKVGHIVQKVSQSNLL